MIVIESPADLRRELNVRRNQGRRIALVPTMGNLHAGHASLVDQARSLADEVVVSIFVNPLQFGPNEDFAQYPRTPAEDESLLIAHGAHILFRPTVQDIYPRGQGESAIVHIPHLAEILCGEFRPGHFDGVATVVTKLLGIVQPDVAIFGEKDFQQLAIIRRAVADLSVPTEILGGTTVREANGLAMSSRNRYLDPSQRAAAPQIFRSLSSAGKKISAGERDFAAIEQVATGELQNAGFKPDYFSVRDAESLLVPAPTTKRFVILTAARIGKARLIDNVQVQTSP
jgi:pantoate--beta-alanine ligase